MDRSRIKKAVLLIGVAERGNRLLPKLVSRSNGQRLIEVIRRNTCSIDVSLETKIRLISTSPLANREPETE